MTTEQIRLNLGSGPQAQAGWHNLDRSPSLTLSRMRTVRAVLHRGGFIGGQHLVDWSPAVIRADLRKPLPYGDGEVSAIYSSHALEHLFFAEAQDLLCECHRVLRDGGVLRLALPDFGHIAKEFATSSLSGVELQHRLNAHPLERARGRARLRGLLSSSIHRWQPTSDLVESLLHTARFQNVEFPEFREGQLPDLSEIETREESLFVETTK